MANDYKIENEEFWFDPLYDLHRYGKIIVAEINEDDLLKQNIRGLVEKGSVEFGDWSALANLLNKEEAQLHEKDFKDEDIEWIVFLYTSGRYVTCMAG